MRHRKKFNHLGRTASHRKALLANMANSLILNKRITTTTAKAKALRAFVEPIITKSKDDSTHSRRIVFSYLQNKFAVTELFREISPKIAERPGGYTRILKTGTRLGDNADMCIIELVDYNENLLTTSDSDKGKTSKRRRRGGSGKTKAETASVEVSKEEVKVKESKVDAPETKVAEVKDAEAPEVEAKVDTPEDNTNSEEDKKEE